MLTVVMLKDSAAAVADMEIFTHLAESSYLADIVVFPICDELMFASCNVTQDDAPTQADELTFI